MTKKSTIAELKKPFLESFSYYAPRCLKIQIEDTTKGSNLIPFTLKSTQRVMEAVVKDIKAKGRLIRIIILKARRQGLSTWVGGRAYWHTSNKFNRYAVTVTHEPEATDFIFKMTKRFHNLVPPIFQPATKQNNAKLLEFNNKEGTGLDSAFRVGTAGKSDYGSGQLIHYLHCSEVAKWDANNATDLLTSLLQTVPKDPDTEIYLESTARGIGGEFHTRFKGARFRYIAKIHKEGRISYNCTVNEDAEISNQYSMVFIPWYIDPKYQMPVSEYEEMTNSTFELDKEEREMKEEHNLTDDHLVWRRWAVSNLCGGNIETFWQEYPTTWEEAFLTSGNPLFDNKKLYLLKKHAPKPIARYNLQFHNNQWIADKDGKLKVWKEPEPGRHYIIGADVAEGLAQGDFNSADVIDHLTGEQIAQWHGKVDTDLYAKILYSLGMRYNKAWLGPEKNNAGISVINRLHNDMEYPKLYVEQVPDPPNKSRKRYGWVTSRATKPEMIDYLVEDVREDSHGIKCAESFEEMMSFKAQEGGALEADPGCFDDRVMSLAIAKILRVKLPPPSRTNRSGGFQPKGRIGRANKGRPALKGIV